MLRLRRGDTVIDADATRLLRDLEEARTLAKEYLHTPGEEFRYAYATGVLLEAINHAIRELS